MHWLLLMCGFVRGLFVLCCDVVIGMSILLISRDERKLAEQMEEIKTQFKVDCKYLVNDFKISASRQFYERLREELKTLDGGIGILVNNVGIANENPQWLEELDDEFTADIINVNCHSMTFMTRAVLPFMREQYV